MIEHSLASLLAMGWYLVALAIVPALLYLATRD